MKIQSQIPSWNTGETVKLPKGMAAERRKEKQRMDIRIEASLSGTKVETAKKQEASDAPPASMFGASAVSIADAVALCGGDLEALRRDGLPDAVDLEALERGLMEITGCDFMKSTADIGRVIEALASRCAVARARIEQEPEGEEKAGRLQALTDLAQRQTKRLAESFADSVGGFYEKHGLDGERDRMYDSVLENARSLMDGYGEALKKSGGWGNIPPEDGWLRNCGEYMASELRGAVARGELPCAFSVKSSVVPIEDLSAASELARAASAVIDGEAAGPVSEEELGVRLGTMALTGCALAELSKARPDHKQAVLDAFGARMDALLDESDGLLAEKAKSGGKKAYPPLDREAVASIVETMIGAYRVTGNLERGLQAGIAKANKRYLEKKNPGGAVERYRRSDYWERMFELGKTGYGRKTGVQRILEGLRAVLPGKVSLEAVFGTDLLGKA